MPSEEIHAGGNDGDGNVPPGPAGDELALLRSEVEFLKKKLQLVGSVTRHDVLNQLTAVMGYNELLGMMIQDEKLVSFLAKERQAIDKIRRQFLFAKDYQNIAVEPPKWQKVDNTVRMVVEELDPGNVRITVSTGTFAVLADQLFSRALYHIFENTLRHAATADEIRVLVEEDGPAARLVIADNGPGIPASDKEKIFERGFGHGTGWGLFLAREILAITGITIIENGEPGKGVRFVLTLPPGTFRSGDAV
jgi:signal transduction histidine kinase